MIICKHYIPINKIYSGYSFTDPDVVYNGVKLLVMYSIKSGDSIEFSLHLKPDVDSSDPTVIMDYTYGFINERGNMCRSRNTARTFIHGDRLYYGGTFYSSDFTRLHRIPRDYAVREYMICIGLSINRLSIEHNNNKLLRMIYSSICSKESMDLIDRQGDVITRLSDDNKEYAHRLSDLELKLEESNLSLTTALQESSVSSPETPSARESSVDAMSTTELLELQEKISEKLRNDRKCKVCLDTETSIVFMPCGHKCCCSACSDQLMTCPVCRADIQSRTNVYD
jgi:hypothetical protein